MMGISGESRILLRDTIFFQDSCVYSHFSKNDMVVPEKENIYYIYVCIYMYVYVCQHPVTCMCL